MTTPSTTAEFNASSTSPNGPRRGTSIYSDPSPTAPAGHAVWCHAAHQLETHLDYGVDDGPAWDRLWRELADTPELCAVAQHYLRLDGAAFHPPEWAQVADRTEELRNQLALDRQQPVERHQLERSVGLELGL